MTSMHIPCRLNTLLCSLLIGAGGTLTAPASVHAAQPSCSVGLIWLPNEGGCASPRPTAKELAAAGKRANSADISLGGNIHADLTIYQGTNPSQGCVSGFTFLAGWGGCVRTSTQNNSQNASCPAGSTGTLTAYQTRTVYTHQNGTARYGPWSAWSAWQGSCTPNPPPVTPAPPVTPSPPAVGTTFTDTISAFVCNSSDPGWYSLHLDTALGQVGKEAIVAKFRSLPNHLGRCPEAAGFNHYRGKQHEYAETFRKDRNLANEWPMSWAWDPWVRDMTLYAIELGMAPNQRAFADSQCLAAANKQFSNVTSAVYITGSGKQCRITGVK